MVAEGLGRYSQTQHGGKLLAVLLDDRQNCIIHVHIIGRGQEANGRVQVGESERGLIRYLLVLQDGELVAQGQLPRLTGLEGERTGHVAWIYAVDTLERKVAFVSLGFTL